MIFNLGRLVATRGISDEMTGNAEFKAFVERSLGRYIKCDWGDTCPEDAKQNDDAVVSGDDRILACYKDEEYEWRIWIITEWDRSYTTILFPEEY